MCKYCIEMSLKATQEENIRCPLCKTFNEENPLDFQSILSDETSLVDQEIEVVNLTSKRKTDQEIFDEIYQSVVRKRTLMNRNVAAETVRIVEPYVIDLTDTDV